MSETPIIVFLNKMTDLLLLNFLWIICCIPVITIGASTTAMYYVLIRSIRYGDGYVIKNFFKAFRHNFKQATIIWAGMLLTGIMFGFDLYFWSMTGTVFAKCMFIISAAIAFVFFITFLYIFPVLSKFENKIFIHLKNAAAMAVGYFHYTLIMIVIVGMACYANYISVAANIIMLLIGFALLSYILSFFFYKVFMKYMEERYDDFDR